MPAKKVLTSDNLETLAVELDLALTKELDDALVPGLRKLAAVISVAVTEQQLIGGTPIRGWQTSMIHIPSAPASTFEERGVTKQDEDLILVATDGPTVLRECGIELSRLFKNELAYSFVPYRGDNGELWLWKNSDNARTLYLQNSVPIYGYAHFSNEDDSWTMTSTWIHPHYRGDGLLRGAWPHFEERYGQNFEIEAPISRSLSAVLEQINQLRIIDE